MIRAIGSLTALAALATLAGGLVVGPAGAGSADAARADGGSPEDGEIGDGPELDEESLADLVADAQRILTLRGYDAGPIDGRFGLQTQRAIRAYQSLAHERGYLEALKGPPPQRTAQGDAAGRRELVRTAPIAPSRTE